MCLYRKQAGMNCYHFKIPNWQKLHTNHNTQCSHPILTCHTQPPTFIPPTHIQGSTNQSCTIHNSYPNIHPNLASLTSPSCILSSLVLNSRAHPYLPNPSTIHTTHTSTLASHYQHNPPQGSTTWYIPSIFTQYLHLIPLTPPTLPWASHLYSPEPCTDQNTHTYSFKSCTTHIPHLDIALPISLTRILTGLGAEWKNWSIMAVMTPPSWAALYSWKTDKVIKITLKNL